MKLADLSWDEVEKYIKKNSQMIIPVGTCEQHGLHLPLSTDTIVAEYLSEVVSHETEILVAPTLNYGINLPCDKMFFGTTTLNYDILQKTISSLLDWWTTQGFTYFHVLTAHGDLFHIKALSEADKESVNVVELYDFEMSDVLEKQTFAKHACEAETSLMLYLFPKLVNMKKAADFETPKEEMLAYLKHINQNPIAGSKGGQGYPTYATKEKGRLLFDRMKVNAVTKVKKVSWYQS